ncbi:S-layer homology domain-containing protein [Brevibacillus fluminis]|uniref:S-layer homology domain-containing protein n=1 Tax=Brevibacillus fluminis TaxID=511487 RepID=UPI003F8AE1C6
MLNKLVMRTSSIFLTICLVVNMMTAMVLLQPEKAAATSSSPFVYYMTSDGTAGSLKSEDALNRMNSDGTGDTVIKDSITKAPGALALDIANNKAYFTDAAGGAGIMGLYSIDLGTGTVTQIKAFSFNPAYGGVAYDPVNDYIYYMTSDGASGSLSNEDALNRIHPDGTGDTVIKSSITQSPGALALDIANNKAYFTDAAGGAGSMGLYSIDLGTGTVTQIKAFSFNPAYGGVAYDPVNDYIYYMTSDGTAGSLKTGDALNRINPDGTGDTVIKSSITKAPGALALDIANNKAYFTDAAGGAGSTGLYSVDLGTGTVTPIKAFTQNPAYGGIAVTSGTVPTFDANNSSPSNGGTLSGSNFSLKFSISVIKGVSGSFTVRDTTSNSTVETIAYTSSEITGWGSDTLTITPSAALTAGHSYSVKWDLGTVQNYYNSFVAANNTDTTYAFTYSGSLQSSPTVTTDASATNITNSGATVGGDVTSDGNATITERGVVYSTSVNPTTSDSKVTATATATTGTFSVSLTGLSANTTYHYRAYATNAQGTSYGSDETFTTSATQSAPTVTTDASATNITNSGATVGGDVTSDGNASITERGIVYSTSANPTTNDSKVTATATTGTFSVSLTGLSANTTYHYRAYAVNAQGTSYGSDQTFTTSATQSAPTVTTDASATNITNSGAMVGGDVTSDGNASITERGIVYSTSANPTTNDSKVTATATTGTFSVSLTGLSANTTYHYRAYAMNAQGTSYGSDETFTTSATKSAPTVTTDASATNITSSGATVGGDVTSDGNATITERGVVYSTSANPTTSDSKVTATATATTGTFSVSLTGLSANMTYHYRAYAVNAQGTSYGSDQTFTTSATQSAPTVTTDASATNITSSGATVGGDVTSDGNASIMERGVVYSTSANPTTSDSKVTATATTGTFSVSLTGLSANTTYHYRAYATNAQGTSYGSDETFTTSATQSAPTVTTDASATNITSSGATVGGDVTSDGNASITERGVVYSTSANPTTSDSKVTATATATTGTFSVSLTGLSANMTYHYRAYATNAQGTSYGSDQTFTTSATQSAPTVTTDASATNITSSGATVGGDVTSDGNASITERGIVYSTSANPTTNDSKVTATATTGTFSVSLTGLSANTTYHYRAYAVNAQGTSYGSDQTFTTSATQSAPTVTTDASATNITNSGAMVGGDVTSDGNATITERGVVYSTSANPTTSDSKVIATATATTGTFSVSLTGLSANTTYHYRAYAVNAQGTSYGSDETFTTSATQSAPTVTTDASATNITSSGATVGGDVTSDGNASITERGVVYSTSANPTTSDSKATATGTTGTFSVSLTGLSAGSTYHYRAYAVNAQGTSYGSDQTFTTDAAPPVPVSDFTNSSKTSTTASFTWTAVSGATSIIIVQSPTGANTWSQATTGTIATNATSATVTSLRAATGYDFRLIVTGGANAGTSNTVTVTTDAAPVTPVTIYVNQVKNPLSVTGLPNGTAKTASALGLPTQVEVSLSNGSTIQTAVNWEVGSVNYDPDSKEEQIFMVTGYLVNLPEGISNPQNLTASIRVTVEAATSETKDIVSVQKPAAITGLPNGTAKKASALGLPEKVEVTLNDGSTISATVKWDVASTDYDPTSKDEQTFTVIGKLVNLPNGVTNSDNHTATIRVTVEAAAAGDIVAVAKLADITGVAHGTAKTAAALGLPAKVEVTLDVGSTIHVGVKWDVVGSDYDPTSKDEQTFTVTGKLVNLPNGVTNSDNHTATIRVTVEAANLETRNITGVIDPADITGVANGTAKTASALGLPTQVKVKLDDGSDIRVDVKWNVAGSDYNPSRKKDQTFSVNGTLVNLPDGVTNSDDHTASIQVTVDAAPHEDDKGDDKGGGESGSSGGGNSGNSSGNGGNASSGQTGGETGSKRHVTVEAGSDHSVTDQVEVNRKVTADGKKVDEVVLDSGTVAKILKRAAENNNGMVRIVIDDLPWDHADEVAVKVPKEALVQLKDGQVSLEIKTVDVTITIPQEMLATLSGNDLYFRIVPIQQPAEQQSVVERTVNADEVKQAAGGQDVQIIGKPMRIETNYANRRTKVTFPLHDVSLPSEPRAQQAFLSTLSVYVEHNDGEKELKTGRVKYDDSGKPVGIEIEISKFSTFTFISLKGKQEQVNHTPYMTGYPNHTFQPNRTVTRAEMAAMLSRLIANEAEGTASAGFADVDGQHWAAKAIASVAADGLMTGDADGKFHPNAPVTRAEMAVIIAKWKQLKPAAGAPSFTDTNGHWAQGSIEAANEQGYMKGYADGSFRPNRLLTRAEVVTLLNRLTGRGPLMGSPAAPWLDVPVNHWAFAEIEEASREHHAVKQADGTEVVTK